MGQPVGDAPLRRPGAIALLALSTVATMLTACTGDEPDPVRVGAVYPLNGAQGAGGIDEFHGVQLAAELVNEDGGVGGRPIEITEIDVPSSDAAAGAVQELDEQGVRFVLGSYGSTISLPAADAAAQRGMLFWETGAVGELSGRGAGDLVFRMAPTGAVLGRTAISFVVDRLARELERDPGDLRYAIANVDDVYGRTVARGARAEIAARGLPFAGRFAYAARTLDERAVVEELAAARPDVLFVSAYLEDGIALREEMVRARLPLVASVGTSSSYCMPAFGVRLGADAVGLFASDKPAAGVLDPDALTPEARALLDRAEPLYEERYGGRMSAAALGGFSNAWALFHHVMPRAAVLDPHGVGEAVTMARVPEGGLPNGSGLSFGRAPGPDAGTNLRAASVIWQWTGVERQAVVWPPAFATEPVRPIHLIP